MKTIRKKILSIINNKFVQFILYSPLIDYHQWRLLSFVKNQAAKIDNKAYVLDIGAGELKYKKYFNHCKYVSNDLCVGDNQWFYDEIDIKSSVYDIPVEDESFDFILCIQVLEHLEFPDLAFKKFNKILKKNGKLLLTAPLGFGEHQIPHDYFRYTKYGLKSLGERNNFKLTYIELHGGIFVNLEYMLWQSIGKLIPFRKYLVVRYLSYFLLLPFKFISGIIFNFLDLFDKKKEYTLNYNCIYEKI